MGSINKHKLASIDFTKKKNLIPGSSFWITTSSEVRSALEEYGCFIAVYDEIPLELHSSIFCQLKDLFELPVQTKSQNKSIKPLFGYYGQLPGLPLYESMGIDYATTFEGVHSFTNLMWPNGNDAFSKTLLWFTKLAAELEQKVTRMVFESYGIGKYYKSHQKAVSYLCRGTKYNGTGKKEGELALPPHTDKDFITLLHQNQVNGLEVKAKDGQWFTVELEPSSYIVMSGDAAMAWSNKRLCSAHHRVTMNGSEPRYSIVQFSFVEGKMIETPEEFVDQDHPLQFKPFDHLKFLKFYGQMESLKLPNSLEAYCGVVKHIQD